MAKQCDDASDVGKLAIRFKTYLILILPEEATVYAVLKQPPFEILIGFNL
jgi:hypothetical protein